jgi:hypothetical protein
MRTCLIALAAMLFSGCAPAQSKTEQDFVQMWSARTNSVRELAEAVNRRFTNGTPVPVIVAALGNNYTRCGSSARLWMGPGPEPPNTTWLSYRFGEEQVIIGSSALFGEDPVTGRFIGAGHSIQVKTTGQLTNRIPIGKQDVPANGQPIRSETNRTSSGASRP